MTTDHCHDGPDPFSSDKGRTPIDNPPPDLTPETACQWVFDTCRLFGASLSTSLLVAGTFVKPFENGHNGGSVTGPEVR